MNKLKARERAIKEEAKKSRNLFIGTAIVTTVVFVLGLLLGNYIATSRIERFQEFEEKFLVQLIALEFREVFVQDVCKLEWQDVWEQKVELGRMLSSLERRLGKDNKKLKIRKEIYELIEIKVLQTLEKIKKECYEDFSIILFFYTNKKNDPLGSVAASEDQGLILDQVYYEHSSKGKKVYTLVFDINSENAASVALRKKYNITKAPALVIDGKTYGYLTKEEIEQLLE
ncbi:MAG: hypothetical protein QXW65_02575 [Candidatus Pacearchaeota archaeon]